MTLPHHTVARADVICPACWEVHQVKGTVREIVTEDGIALYRRCACGASIEIGTLSQPDLFATEVTV